MSQSKKYQFAILYEPRQLFNHAARQCIEASGYPVNNIYPDGIIENVFSFNNPDVLIAVGLSGAGQELYTLLRIIHQTTEYPVNLVVWLPEQDKLLANLMRAMGVNSMIREIHLTEELPLRLNNPLFFSPYFPVRSEPLSRGGVKCKLSRTELDIIIDSACGLNAREIAVSRHLSYKTIFAHIHNARVKLSLEDRISWFNLLSGLQMIATKK
ncbi:hypothetical protein [Enterobacter quasiroggenkampii]|uniref:hypothetical protein n=1 Tax=Enterobacter quasiroggenkampii TaxID=2497436 RepID=UPI0021CF9594|nr:hypothetical protein [Enterobacter quasiroggenkampii]MCU6278852.1 LuxR C-terminal-related transcriptional regulator [Enterobacter quasiroggenkampii]